VPHLFLIRKVFHGDFSIAQNNSENIIKIVSDPAGHGIDGFHLVGLLKLIFQFSLIVLSLFLFRDVSQMLDDAGNISFVIQYGIGSAVQPYVHLFHKSFNLGGGFSVITLGRCTVRTYRISTYEFEAFLSFYLFMLYLKKLVSGGVISNDPVFCILHTDHVRNCVEQGLEHHRGLLVFFFIFL